MPTKNSIPATIKMGVVLLITLLVIACSSPTDLQLVQTAKGYLAQNKIYEAAIELKNALQANPENAEARYLLGEVNFKVGDFASAEKEFTRAANAGWPEEQTQLNLARIALFRNALQPLLDNYDVKSSYSTSAQANLYAIHALAYAGLENMAQAEKLLHKAIKLDAKARHVLKASVQLQLVSGDMTAANKSLKQALALYGDEQEILLLSAIVALSNKDQDAAIVAYGQVIALEPPNVVTFFGRKARLSLARIEISNGRLDQAQTALNLLLRQGVNDPEVNFVSGFLAFQQGELELATKRLLLVLKVAPDHAQTQLLFGAVSYSQHNYEQAAYYLARYLSVEPGNLRARKLLGRAYIKLDQNEKAQTALQPALRDNDSDAELLALIGLSQIQAGNAAAGIKGLEQAVKAAPENLALKSELAKAYMATGETENAIKALNAMLASGGDKKHTQVMLIATQIKTKQYDQAIGVVIDMLREYPDDPAVLSLAGNVFAISNDRVEARKYFNRALQVSPGYVPATMLLASLEELEEHPAKAIQMYKKLAQVNLEDIGSLMALARLAKVQNRPEDMVDWLQRAGKRAPHDIRSRKLLIEHYLRNKQLRQADLLLKEVIDFSSGDNPLLDLEARLQMAEGYNNKALATLNKLVVKVPDMIYVRALLAEVYLKLGQRADARAQLEFALKKHATYVPALALMANLEIQSGNFDKAMSFALKLQEVQPDLYLGYEIAGDAAMNKKNYSAAMSSYKQAWRRKPVAGLVVKQSEAASLNGQFAEASQLLRNWLQAHPEDIQALLLFGTAQQNLKQNDKAIKTFEKVLQMQANNVVALNNLAWLYSLSNNPLALKLAEAAHEAQPGNSGIQDTYGWILVQQGQVEKGRQILELVIKALPTVPEVQYHYAVALLKSGEKVKARKILTKLLKTHKSFEGRDEAKRLLK